MKYSALFVLLVALCLPVAAAAQQEPTRDADDQEPAEAEDDGPRTLANVGEEQRARKEEAREEESKRAEPIRALVSGDAAHGDYGGPSLKLSSVDGDLAMFLGARGGWVIDHTVVLGLAGYLSANDIDARQRFGANRAVVNFDYWGVFGEYIIATNDVLHVTLDLFGGAGRASYEPDAGADRDAIPDEHTSVFVGEASANGELNITKHLRLTIGGGYRYVDGPSLEELSARDLSGFVATATFKVGIF